MIHIVESIVITQVGEMNQPWYGLVMKYDQPSAAVIIVKIERHILFLDPNALNRGSIKIRNFMSFATKYNDESEACQMFDQLIGETSRKPANGAIFRNSINKVIYPADLAKVIQTFPIIEGQRFAAAAMKRAIAHAYGTEQQQTAREKQLMREIAELKTSKRKKKKRNIPDY